MIVSSFLFLAAMQPPLEPFPASGSGSTLLALVCAALALTAGWALWGIFAARREMRDAARAAREREQTFGDLLRTIRMAESLAGIGVWQYDYESGTQQWSDGLKGMFGIERDLPLLEGDAESLLFSMGVDLVQQVRQRATMIGTFTLEFEIVGFDLAPRKIELQACNLRGKNGAVSRVVGVVRDVTDRSQDNDAWQYGIRTSPRITREPSRAETCPAGHSLSCPARGTDPVTGVLDQRRVMNELDLITMQSREASEPLILAMFEVDHLDRLTTNYGKSESDQILKYVAHIVQEQARCSDLVGRVGPGEFVWIIRGGVDGSPRAMTERLRQTIANRTASGEGPAVTVSLGFATMQPGDSALTLFGRADRALHEARQSGRNRVRAAA